MGFEDLPIEVAVVIYDLLDFGSKLEARLVCKEWAFLMDEYFFVYRVLLRNKTFKYVKNLKSNSKIKQCKQLTVRGFSKDICNVPKTKSRSPLMLSPDKLIFERSRGRTPKNGLDENMSTILRLNDNISLLEFTPGSLNSVKSLKINGLQLNNLKRLKISVSLFGQNDTNLVQQFSQIKMPSLVELELLAGIYNLNNFVNDQTLFKLAKLLVAIHTNVKKLTFGHLLSPRFDWCLPLTLAPQTELESLCQSLERVEVEELCLKLIPRDDAWDCELGLVLLNAQKNLKKLHMEIYPGRDSQEFKLCSKQVVLNNAASLTNLEISCNGYGDRCWLLSNYIEDVWSAIARCTALQTLDLAGFWVRRLLFPWPSSLKHLILGLIKPCVLLETKLALPVLETLEFGGFAHEETPDYTSVATHLEELLSLPHLKTIRWKAEGENLDSLTENRDLGICIARSYEMCRYGRKCDFITISKAGAST